MWCGIILALPRRMRQRDCVTDASKGLCDGRFEGIVWQSHELTEKTNMFDSKFFARKVMCAAAASPQLRWEKGGLFFDGLGGWLQRTTGCRICVINHQLVGLRTWWTMQRSATQAIEGRRRSHVEAARQLQRANGCAYAGIKIIKRLIIIEIVVGRRDNGVVCCGNTS